MAARKKPSPPPSRDLWVKWFPRFLGILGTLIVVFEVGASYVGRDSAYAFGAGLTLITAGLSVRLGDTALRWFGEREINRPEE